MQDAPNCPNCGKEMFGPAGGIGYYCPDGFGCGAVFVDDTLVPDTVTITISREAAEELHRYYWAEDRPHEQELEAALQAALKETE